jgi:PEP-CTERM motif
MWNARWLAAVGFALLVGGGAGRGTAWGHTIDLTESGKEQDIKSSVCSIVGGGVCPITTATFTSDAAGGAETADTLTIVYSSGNQGNKFTVTGESGRILETGFAPPVGPMLGDIIFHEFLITDNTESDRIVVVPDLTGKLSVVFSSDAEATVPEPSTMILLCTGLFGLFCCGWRQRNLFVRS